MQAQSTGPEPQTPVESRQELLQHGLGVFHVAAPASLSSVASRAWKVPAVRSTRPLACGERAKINCIPISAIARPNWVGVPAGLYSDQC